MRSQVRPCIAAGPSWAALFALTAALPGCNLVASAWLGGSEHSASLGPAARADGPGELQISLRPGVALLQAAQRAPRVLAALPGRARQLGELSLRDGQYLHAVSTGLLDEGLLLPGPLGMVEVRIIAPEPAVQSAGGGDGMLAALAGPGCTAETTPPALVGAYRAGPRLLLLRADGQFVLEGGSRPSRSGRYALRCQTLQLIDDSAAPLRLEPLGRDGWRDYSGAAFLPFTAQPHGDTP